VWGRRSPRCRWRSQTPRAPRAQVPNHPRPTPRLRGPRLKPAHQLAVAAAVTARVTRAKIPPEPERNHRQPTGGRLPPMARPRRLQRHLPADAPAPARQPLTRPIIRATARAVRTSRLRPVSPPPMTPFPSLMSRLRRTPHPGGPERSTSRPFRCGTLRGPPGSRTPWIPIQPRLSPLSHHRRLRRLR